MQHRSIHRSNDQIRKLVLVHVHIDGEPLSASKVSPNFSTNSKARTSKNVGITSLSCITVMSKHRINRYPSAKRRTDDKRINLNSNGCPSNKSSSHPRTISSNPIGISSSMRTHACSHNIIKYTKWAVPYLRYHNILLWQNACSYIITPTFRLEWKNICETKQLSIVIRICIFQGARRKIDTD